MTFLPLTVPRGEQMGKGARCDAVAEHSVANPTRFFETPRYGFAVRIPLPLIVPLRRADGKGVKQSELVRAVANPQ